MADKFIELGLNKIGYEYVNIDDCWAVSRNSTTGRLVPDPSVRPTMKKKR